MSRRRRGDSSDEYSEDDSDGDADHKRRRRHSFSPMADTAIVGGDVGGARGGEAVPIPGPDVPGRLDGALTRPHWGRSDGSGGGGVGVGVGQQLQPHHPQPQYGRQQPKQPIPGGGGGGGGGGWGGGHTRGGLYPGGSMNRGRPPAGYGQDSVEPYVPQPVYGSSMGGMSFNDLPPPPPPGALPLPFLPAMMGGFPGQLPPPPAAPPPLPNPPSGAGNDGRGWGRHDGGGSSVGGGGQAGSRGVGGGGRGASRSGGGEVGRGGGGRGRGRDGPRAQSTLFVSNLPTEHPDLEAALRRHYSRFGRILQMRVRFTDNPARGHFAFVQLTDRAAAERALADQEAILGNRFVRAMLAQRDITDGMPEGQQLLQQVQVQQQQQQQAGGWGGGASYVPQQQPPPPRGAPPPRPLPPVQPAPPRTAPPPPQTAATEEKMKALASMQETLAKQIAEQKRMLDALAKKSGPAGGGEGGAPSVVGASESNGGQQGERNAVGVGVVGVSHAGRGVGAVGSAGRGPSAVAVRGRGRRGAMGAGRGWGGAGGSSWSKLDTRSTTIVRVVELPVGLGVAELSAHFSQFGEVVHSEGDGAGARITFDTRKQAEAALINGKRVGEASMILQWASASIPPAPPIHSVPPKQTPPLTTTAAVAPTLPEGGHQEVTTGDDVGADASAAGDAAGGQEGVPVGNGGGGGVAPASGESEEVTEAGREEEGEKVGEGKDCSPAAAAEQTSTAVPPDAAAAVEGKEEELELGDEKGGAENGREDVQEDGGKGEAAASGSAAGAAEDPAA